MIEKLPAEILVATGNKGKVDELREMLSTVPVKLRYLGDVGQLGEVEETGSTFEENARLKAAEYARRSAMWSIADDSGLEIDALGGEPGVLSARYGAADLGFAGKMDLVLDRIAPDAERTARFVCVMALADEAGNVVFTAEGICSGTIAERPRGVGGFGYDPIFVPDGYDATFGELPPAVKQQISHRAKASALLIRYLLHFNDV